MPMSRSVIRLFNRRVFSTSTLRAAEATPIVAPTVPKRKVGAFRGG